MSGPPNQPPFQASSQQSNDGNQSFPSSSSSSFPMSQQQPSFQFSQEQQQQQQSNSSEFSALSAIHTPIDFGDAIDGGQQSFNSLMPPSTMPQQQQFLVPPGNMDFSGQNSGFASPTMYMSTPGMTDISAAVSGTSTPLVNNENDNKQNKTSGTSKPRAPKKQKIKANEGDGSVAEGIHQNAEEGENSNSKKQQNRKIKKEDETDPQLPKKPKQRKSKPPKTGDENGEAAGAGTSFDAPTPGSIDQQGNGEDGSVATAKRAKSGTGKARGGRGGRGGGSVANSRRPSQANMDNSMGDLSIQEESFSRSGSIAPATGESTPTKRGGRASGVGSRGGRGGGKRRSTAGRAGSRATSGRGTASVVPGQESGTAAPEDSQRLGDGMDEGYENGGAVGVIGEDAEEEMEDDEEEEEFDQGLEEDELDRQEAIQRQRAINMGPLMKAMTEEQQDRYSAFRRHYLDKRFVKRLLHHLTRQVIVPQVNTLVAGVGKVFIGEIVEGARRVRQERLELVNGNSSKSNSDHHQQPLQPDHLIESLRRYREERELPGHYPPGTPNAGAGVSANGKRRRLF